MRDILVANGYQESKKKPNLFYKRIDEKILLFFDLRKKKIDLGEKYFFYQVLAGLTREEEIKYNKLILNEFFSMRKKLNTYVSFFNLNICCNCEKSYVFGFEPDDEEYFDDYIDFCSEKCFKEMRKLEEEEKVKETVKLLEEREKNKCVVCRKRAKLIIEQSFAYLDDYNKHNHHIDYDKNKTVPVCDKCHAKITFHLDKYPELEKYKPIGNRKHFLEKKKEKETLYCKLCKKKLEGRRTVYCSDDCRVDFYEEEKEKKRMKKQSELKKMGVRYTEKWKKPFTLLDAEPEQLGYFPNK